MSDSKTLQIKAAVVRSKGAPFVIEPATLRRPENDEVLVKIIATGMCHTDMIIRDQYYPVPLPAVLGHEGAGIVEAVGPQVRDLVIGDHVVLTFGSCGHCVPCAGGHSTYCKDYYNMNFSGADPHGHCAIDDAQGKPLHDHFFSQSSFATYSLSRESNAIKVPKEAPLELLGPLGCGIQTGAGSVINSLKVTPGSSFAAFGSGAVGLSAILAAKVAGATVIIAVDVVPSRLQLALDLGATHAINSKNEDPVAAIQAITGGGVDFALESTGIPTVLRQSVDALGGLGCVGVVGASHLGTLASFDVNDLLIRGKSIRGICEGDSVPQKFIPDLVNLYMQGRFPFDKMVKFYSFEQINEAAADSERGDTLKPILRIA
ncbi:NAD(P)-dependent alcohol dehydrogenase [Pseudomonas akapageensis]|uniref:NAD(P)-dependent alcohol dehydrogenase n=1 Tax=Pseudomonas akapageensis TaxID=2609961 RepID=UPI00140B9F79|nr:NAD(P)-dependent alcohol dehydrogenase [Pseudomonas akapageensis]